MYIQGFSTDFQLLQYMYTGGYGGDMSLRIPTAYILAMLNIMWGFSIMHVEQCSTLSQHATYVSH